ncbi:MAG: NUDIX domain-containing protein [Tannerella sp.]|jgi:isopentenyldiphosphate isomerase|nr:NUDIX domain-containing protein [Tannerella sp.]
MQPDKEEWFPIVNEAGETLGKLTRKECHNGCKALHPVVHLHLFNSAGELYLQKRPAHKDVQPNKWDTAVGGHVDYGETIEEALLREAREELGITGFTPVPIARYVFESAVEKELVHSFRTVYTGEVHPDPDELDGGCFWPIAKIQDHLGKGIFTPNFEVEFQYIRKDGGKE